MASVSPPAAACRDASIVAGMLLRWYAELLMANASSGSASFSVVLQTELGMRRGVPIWPSSAATR
jgi:hypothetical protein